MKTSSKTSLVKIRSTFFTFVGLDSAPGRMESTTGLVHIEERRERTEGPRGSSEMCPHMVVGQKTVAEDFRDGRCQTQYCLSALAVQKWLSETDS